MKSTLDLDATLSSKSRVCRLRDDVSGIAAVEFAALLPVMLLLYFASAELTHTIMAGHRVTLATDAMAGILGQQLNSTTVNGVAGIDDGIMNAIFAAATPIMSPNPVSGGQLKMTLSSITFVPTSPGATTYNAKTDWSVTATSGTLRPCYVTLSQIPNTATPSATGVPVGLYGPGSILAADVTYNYPSPFKFDLGFYASPTAIPISRTVFNTPRNVKYINYVGTQGVLCASPANPH